MNFLNLNVTSLKRDVDFPPRILSRIDITVKGLDAVRRCERVYLEAYTSILLVDRECLVGSCMSSDFQSYF